MVVRAPESDTRQLEAFSSPVWLPEDASFQWLLSKNGGFFPHAFGKCSQKLRQETILFCRSKFWDTPNIAQDRWFAVKGCLQLACSTSAHLIRSHRPFLGNPSFSKWTDSFSQRIGSSVMPSQQADYFFCQEPWISSLLHFPWHLTWVNAHSIRSFHPDVPTDLGAVYVAYGIRKRWSASKSTYHIISSAGWSYHIISYHVNLSYHGISYPTIEKDSAGSSKVRLKDVPATPLSGSLPCRVSWKKRPGSPASEAGRCWEVSGMRGPRKI